MNNIIRILPIKYVKKANMFLLTWEESGAKSQTQKWFSSLEKAEEEKINLKKENEIR